MTDERAYPPVAESRLPQVGTFRRTVPVGLDRVYENALDWERLPHVHSNVFASIECDDAGPWGWRGRTVDRNGQTRRIELRLDRLRRLWIACVLDGANVRAEVWTRAFPIAPRLTDVVVDCFVSRLEPDEGACIGDAFAAACRDLFEGDVAMMIERQRQIDRRVETQNEAAVLDLAIEALELPVRVEFDGRAYVVVRGPAGLLAHVARCPHQLGPLVPAVAGVTACPWHGYRFDIATGICLTGGPCRLPPAPRVSVRDGVIRLER